MSVATWLRSLFTTQDPTTYKSAIDGNFAVLERVGAMFACQQAAVPNMTVVIRAGSLMDNGSLVEAAQQTTATITAPVSTSRIDRVVIDQRTGVHSVVAGAPSGTPVPPAIPAGKLPCAQILLQSTTVAIPNAMITDERVFCSTSKAYEDSVEALLAPLASPTFTGIPRAPTAGTGDNSTQLATTAYADAAAIAASFPSGTRMPFNQTAAPPGWTKDTAAALNDTAMRIVTGTVGSGGSSSFSTVFGKFTTDAHTLTVAEIPSHSHTSFKPGLSAGTDVAANSSAGWGGLWPATTAAGGGGAHAHNMDIRVKYNDFIIAQKN